MPEETEKNNEVIISNYISLVFGTCSSPLFPPMSHNRRRRNNLKYSVQETTFYQLEEERKA